MPLTAMLIDQHHNTSHTFVSDTVPSLAAGGDQPLVAAGRAPARPGPVGPPDRPGPVGGLATGPGRSVPSLATRLAHHAQQEGRSARGA